MTIELQKQLDEYVAGGLLYRQEHPTLDLSIYNYTQRTQFSGFWNELTLACRGKVFTNEGVEVTRPLKKFFNIEEKKFVPTDKFDVFTKVDGSFIQLFSYKKKLIFTSRGSFTSAHVEWAKEIWQERLNGFIYNIPEGYTYCLELIHPENRIVCDYGDRKDLVLLAVFDKDGYELPYELIHDDWSEAIPIVERHDGIEDFTKLQELNAQNEEGYVVRFSNGDRVKIKFSDYVRLHRAVTDLTTTRVYEALVSGTLDRWLEDIPDEFFNKIKECAFGFQEQYRHINQYCQEIYGAIGHIDNRKKYAEQVISTGKYSGILFSMKDGKDYSKYIWKLIEPEHRKL